MGELKPCPFCGGTKLMICDSPCGWNAGGKAYAVTCCARDCHGAIFSLGHDLFATPHEAVASWNIRAFDQAAELRGAEKMRDAAVEWLRGYAEEMEEFHSVAPGFLRGAADQIATFNFAEELD